MLAGAGLAENFAATTALVGITLAIACLSLLLGELVPKRLAMQNAAGFTRMLAPPLGFFSQLMRPVIWLLPVSTDLVLRALGVDPRQTRAEISAAELRELVEHNAQLADISRSILSDVFGAGERTLQEAMRPRPEVEFLPASLSVQEARERAAGLPYSRYPVIGESTDEVLGFIHIRDLFPQRASGQNLAALVRELPALPGSNKVLPTLAQMRAQNHHIVLIVDEYGGTDGIVAFEELVGEIYDEFDLGKDPEDKVVGHGDAIEIDGGLVLQEFEALTGVALHEGKYDTVAGFIISELGRMPQTGDQIRGQGLELRIRSMRQRRIGWGQVRKLPGEGELPGR